MPEQRVEAVNFHVCEKHPQLIGYDSNVCWTNAQLRPSVSFIITLYI